MKLLSCVLLLAGIGCSAAPVETPAVAPAAVPAVALPGEATEPPRPEDVLRTLMRAGDTLLMRAGNHGCGGVAEGGTLRDYLAVLVAFGGLENEESDTSLKLSCVDGATVQEIVIDEPLTEGEHYWACTLASRSVDRYSGDPWNYELRFLLRKSDQSLDVNRLFCPGAP